MNYVERHFGDWARDTAHLSMLEDGAYNRLCDLYYVRETPLPADLPSCYRLVRAVTKQEREAVKSVLQEFFDPSPDGWTHKRCDAEIDRFRSKSGKASASAKARWYKQPAHSDGNANAHANASPDAMRTHSERNANGMPRAGADARTPTPHSPLPKEEMEPRNTLVLVGTPAAPPTYRRPSCPTEEIVALFHEHLPGLPRVEIISDGRKRHVSARWAAVCGESKYDRQQGLEWFAWFFGHVAKSAFLTGGVKGRNGEPPFRCTFDFLMTPEKFTRVIENFYHKETA